MNEIFSLFSSPMIETHTIAEILETNNDTARFGLTLSLADAKALANTRQTALAANGRIEFGGGTIEKLIEKFSDSPYISQNNYAETLHTLVETFYYFKGEFLETLGDDELLDLMKEFFDRSCQGSLELLQHRELEIAARNLRYGQKEYQCVFKTEEDIDEEEGNEE